LLCLAYLRNLRVSVEGQRHTLGLHCFSDTKDMVYCCQRLCRGSMRIDAPAVDVTHCINTFDACHEMFINNVEAVFLLRVERAGGLDPPAGHAVDNAFVVINVLRIKTGCPFYCFNLQRG